MELLFIEILSTSELTIYLLFQFWARVNFKSKLSNENWLKFHWAPKFMNLSPGCKTINNFYSDRSSPINCLKFKFLQQEIQKINSWNMVQPISIQELKKLVFPTAEMRWERAFNYILLRQQFKQKSSHFLPCCSYSSPIKNKQCVRPEVSAPNQNAKNLDDAIRLSSSNFCTAQFLSRTIRQQQLREFEWGLAKRHSEAGLLQRVCARIKKLIMYTARRIIHATLRCKEMIRVVRARGWNPPWHINLMT